MIIAKVMQIGIPFFMRRLKPEQSTNELRAKSQYPKVTMLDSGEHHVPIWLPN